MGFEAQRIAPDSEAFVDGGRSDTDMVDFHLLFLN
jgi:hypothetical protein